MAWLRKSLLFALCALSQVAVAKAQQAVSIKVYENPGAAGFILPNECVDVLFIEILATSPDVRAEIVAKNALVLRLGDANLSNADIKVRDVTLSMLPSHAKTVLSLKGRGILTLRRLDACQ